MTMKLIDEISKAAMDLARTSPISRNQAMDFILNVICNYEDDVDKILQLKRDHQLIKDAINKSIAYQTRPIFPLKDKTK